jgi:heterodisulfide reductase subunit A
MTRTGIFLCTCDGKIGKAVDVDLVAQNLGTDSRFISITPHLCLPDGMRALKQTIVDEHLDRVVVAACPARFQEKHLRAECERAGVKQFALVDWREGCAYAHRGEKANATAKARDMLEMGIAYVSNAREIHPIRTPIVQRALVIGGGIAGMTAALELAQRGVSVTLVEREMVLGGQLHDIALNGSTGQYEQTKRAVILHPRITLYLNARLTDISGAVGNYRVHIEYPNGDMTFNVGAIIVATGAQEFNDAHLYHHDGRRVVTLTEFEKQISNLQSPVSKLESPLSIIYILCAGSRDAQHPYCSNVCCLGALHQAMRVKRAHPETRVTILFRDLYLLGDEWNEQIVLDAQKLGIEFLRYAPNQLPRVEDDWVVARDTLTGTLRRIEYDRVVLATPLVPRDDAGVLARWLHLPRDENGFFIDPHYRVRPEAQIERGIFVCGSAHRPVDFDNAILQGKTAAARAGHFLEKHFVTHPSASACVNADLCTGCAQCVETCAFGAIEMRSGDLNRGNTWQNRPASVEFQSAQADLAIGSRDFESPLDRAHIDPFLCLACGNCVVACPSKAIDLPNARDAQIFAQIDAVLRNDDSVTLSPRHPVTLVFGCTWSGHAAMELAGARRMNYSANVRVIELPCSARLDPLHVLYALVHGAEKVLLALCPPDECHFGNGNRYAEMRIENLRAQLAANGIDPQRVAYARMMGDDAKAWVKMVRQI